ncbi:MAG: hypothetical protein HY904_01470 [Deltaproteobacteria bacterium]|nr:hypothetical protein [Deltaproteobacteria bacterium]
MAISPGAVSRFSVGSLVTRMLGAITGRPPLDRLDEGAAIRARMGDGTEPSSALLLGTLNRMFGRQFALEGFVPGPADYYQQRGGIPQARGFTALGGMGGDAAFAQTQVGRSLSMALLTDPDFRGQLESALGGSVLNTGSSTGGLLCFRAPATQPAEVGGVVGGQGGTSLQNMAVMHAAAVANAVPGVPSSMGPILQGLMQMEQNVKNVALSLSGGGAQQAQPNGNFQDFQAQLFQSAAALGSPGGGDEMSAMPVGNGMLGNMAGGQGSGGRPLMQQNVPGAIAGAQQPMSDTMKQQLLQQMTNQLRKFYEMLTNVIKQMHDMQKSAIDNIKA